MNPAQTEPFCKATYWGLSAPRHVLSKVISRELGTYFGKTL